MKKLTINVNAEILENIKEILNLKGSFCLSDDSHGISQIGQNYSKMYSYMRRIGINEVKYLCKPKEGSGRKVGMAVATLNEIESYEAFDLTK